MKKFFYIFFLAVILVVVIQGGYYFYTYYYLPTRTTKRIPSLSQSRTSSQLGSGYTILSQAKEDILGRTVVFASPENKIKAHSQAGVFYLQGTRTISYLVGDFSSWEEIPDSSDRYLVLTNPLKEEGLPKFRVSFSPSPYVSGSERVNKVTSLEILDLNKLEAKQEEKVSFYKFINQISNDELSKILKPGDILTIRPYFEQEQVITKDENGFPLAASIYLRRFGGKETLAKEIE